MPEPRTSPIGPLCIGPYQVQAILHRGPDRVLYRAQDSARKARVILRVPARAAKSAALLDQYQWLWETARRLDHPGLHRALELGRDEAAGPYLVLEDLEGTCLAPLILDGLPLFSALHLLVQLVHILEAGAQAGIFHGDLQPCNIWVSPQGKVHVQGFGATGALLAGTMAYAAPERLERGSPSARADQFSLAALAFHLLAGRPPFAGTISEDSLRAARNLDLKFPHEMPPQLQKVFLKAMDGSPEARYGSIRDFLAVGIAAAPLEEERQDDLLSFLDGKPLSLDGAGLLPLPAAGSTEEPAVPSPERRVPARSLDPLLQNMQAAFAKVVGPMAGIIFQECLDQWANEAEPRRENLPRLLALLMQQAGDAERAARYRSLVQPLL